MNIRELLLLAHLEQSNSYLSWFLNQSFFNMIYSAKDQRKYYIGLKYNSEKQEVGGQLPKKGCVTLTQPFTTKDQIAEQFDVSPSTVLRAAKAVDELAEYPELESTKIR